MTEGDFDLSSLAEYLHLSAAQVGKMADRGLLPGRKVAGQWRFSGAEIHHWLEERMGVLDDDDLEHLEGALRRSAGDNSPEVSIAELLSLEAIAVPLPARTRSSVITSMVELAAATGQLWDASGMAAAVRAREELYPTAMESGVALLHPRRPLPGLLAQPLLAFGRTDTGIPFGDSRGAMTDLFFLICSVDDSGHLRMLRGLEGCWATMRS